jgi:dTDP-4-amino-4,6-dideoxygalactose transaminase
MEFIDLAAQQRRIRADLERRIGAVLDHGQYVNGPEIAELERALAQDSGTRHAVACSSGTDALLLALMALDIGRGDAVLTSPFTFFATVEVICLLGATPVFVDIDPETFNLDPRALARTLQAIADGDFTLPGSKVFGKGHGLVPKAVIAVDLFGLPADYDRIAPIAKQFGLYIIEDAAQAFGALYKGRPAGALGDIGCTSFFPAKPLGGYGEGGMCFTDQDALAGELQSLRSHGQGAHRYQNVRIGLNARMDTLQAAILLAKHRVFREECTLRRRIADRYNDLLSPAVKLKLPTVPEGSVSVWAQYAVLAESSTHRQAVLNKLNAHQIPTAIYYPIPCHRQRVALGQAYARGDFPVSEDCAQRIFNIPIHPYLTANDQVQIAELIRAACV